MFSALTCGRLCFKGPSVLTSCLCDLRTIWNRVKEKRKKKKTPQLPSRINLQVTLAYTARRLCSFFPPLDPTRLNQWQKHMACDCRRVVFWGWLLIGLLFITPDVWKRHLCLAASLPLCPSVWRPSLTSRQLGNITAVWPKRENQCVCVCVMPDLAVWPLRLIQPSSILSPSSDGPVFVSFSPSLSRTRSARAAWAPLLSPWVLFLPLHMFKKNYYSRGLEELECPCVFPFNQWRKWKHKVLNCAVWSWVSPKCVRWLWLIHL